MVQHGVHERRRAAHRLDGAVVAADGREVALKIFDPAIRQQGQALLSGMWALVGVAAVLCAVFVPVSFSSGSVGEIYRQFSVTMVCPSSSLMRLNTAAR